MSFVLVLSLLGFLIVLVHNNVTVTDSGVIPWKEGDFAITFYVTLKNDGNRPVAVVAAMKKCCEKISETDVDCNHIHLIGSNTTLEAGRAKNITLPYLNVYSYNRCGICDIRINITFNNNLHLDFNVTRRIHFDTSLIQGTFSSLLQGHYKMKCKFPDEDPLDSCFPVNCHIKYSGYRGFYSTSKKKCVQIPKCHSTKNDNQTYLWSTNQCVDLNNTVSQKDIQELLYRIENIKEDNYCHATDNIHTNKKIRCHNGRLDSFTDLCVCNPGWENENEIDWDDFIPSTIPLQLCTVRSKNSGRFVENFTNDLVPNNWTSVELVSFDIFKSLRVVEIGKIGVGNRHIVCYYYHKHVVFVL